MYTPDSQDNFPPPLPDNLPHDILHPSPMDAFAFGQVYALDVSEDTDDDDSSVFVLSGGPNPLCSTYAGAFPCTDMDDDLQLIKDDDRRNHVVDRDHDYIHHTRTPCELEAAGIRVDAKHVIRPFQYVKDHLWIPDRMNKTAFGVTLPMPKWGQVKPDEPLKFDLKTMIRVPIGRLGRMQMDDVVSLHFENRQHNGRCEMCAVAGNLIGLTMNNGETVDSLIKTVKRKFDERCVVEGGDTLVCKRHRHLS